MPHNIVKILVINYRLHQLIRTILGEYVEDKLVYIPEFLNDKRIIDTSNSILEVFCEQTNIVFFDEITQDIINLFYSKSKSETFIKVMQILGLYGLQFYNSHISFYSINNFDKQDFIICNKTEEQIIYYSGIYAKEANILSKFFQLLEIISYKHLYGLSLDVISKLTDIQKNTIYEILQVNCKEQNTKAKFTNNTEINSNLNNIDLPLNVYEVLNNHNITTLSQFISLTDNEILLIAKSKSKLMKDIKYQRDRLRVIPTVETFVDSDTQSLQNKADFQYLDSYLLEEKIIFYKLPRLKRVFSANNINTIGDILSSDLSKISGIGKNKIESIRSYLKHKGIELGVAYQVKETETYPYTIKDFKVELDLYVAHLDGIEKDIYDYRLSIYDGMTLQDLGDQHKLTRERIRQQEKKIIDELIDIIDVFHFTLEDLFMKYGNVISYNIIELECIKSYIPLIDNVLRYIDEENILFDRQYELIGLNFQMTDIEFDTDDEESFSDEDIKSIVYNKTCEICNNNDKDKEINFNKVYEQIDSYIKDTFLIYIPENKRYVVNQKLNELLYRTFKELYPLGEYIQQNISEIYDQFSKHYPDIDFGSQRALIGRLISKKSPLLLTKRGYYQHRDCIKIDDEVIDYGIKLCLEKIEKTLTPFNVLGIYKQAEEYFKKNGIESEYLLYSLMKEKQHDLLKFDHLNICKNDISQISRIEIFEEYFEEKSGFVSKEEVEAYFCKELGWAKYRLDNCLSDSQIIYKGDNEYFNVNKVNINIDKINDLKALIDKNINKGVALKGIQKDYGQLWLDCVNGTDVSVKVMRSILLYYFPELNISPAGFITSLQNVKEHVIRWMNDECIKNGFVNAYSISEYCNQNYLIKHNILTALEKDILQIDANNYITREHVNISDEFIDNVYNKVNREFQNKPFIIINKQFLEFSQLPFNKNILWNPYTIMSILKFKDGNYKMFYNIIYKSSYEISCIIREIIKNKYQRKLIPYSEFIGYLLDNEIINSKRDNIKELFKTGYIKVRDEGRFIEILSE